MVLRLLQEQVVGDSLIEYLTLTALVTGISAFWHKHNCHEHGCLRLSWHPDSDGHPVCKVHHPEHPSRGLWWAIKHFVGTGEIGDHDHPRHRKHEDADQ
jgi:hypothetical protein